MQLSAFKLKNMRGTLLTFVIFLIIFPFTSCQKEDPVDPPAPPVTEPTDPDNPSTTGQTLLMYMPWSDNLTSFFYQNISDMESAIRQGILKQERVLVFISTDPTEASLFELVVKDGKSQRNELKSYSQLPFTTAEGITSILNDVKRFAPAKRYAMTIGCHGMGWIPVSEPRAYAPSFKSFRENNTLPVTRYFGGLTATHQTDITTLAQGISNAGIKMEYLMFDDCYMSNVEVAYDLRNVTGYLIGCATEIMAYGMPYEKIGRYMVGNIDYKAICDEFYSFYSTYQMPHGNIAVTNCSELDKLALVMKEINARYVFDDRLESSLQKLDGITPTVFFDYEDYVSKLCKDAELLARLTSQLERTVPFKRYTDYFYSDFNRKTMKIDTFCGLTVSDPSSNTQYASRKKETNWYKDTHQ